MRERILLRIWYCFEYFDIFFFSVFNANYILKCQKQKRIEQQLSYINFLSSLVGGDKISGQNDLAVGEDKYEKILTRKVIHNKIEIN